MVSTTPEPTIAKCSTSQSSRSIWLTITLTILTDIVGCIKELCLEGKKVKLDNFGFFYPSIRSKGALSEKDFNAFSDIYGCRIRFLGQGESKNAVYNQMAKVSEADWYDGPNKLPQP